MVPLLANIGITGRRRYEIDVAAEVCFQDTFVYSFLLRLI